MSRSKRNPLAIQNIVQEAQRVYQEQVAAQIAATTCDVVVTAIKRGTKNAIKILKTKKYKTKYDYQKERVRNFATVKNPSSSNDRIVSSHIDIIESDPDLSGKVTYQMLVTDPSQFVRDYENKVFENLLKQIHPRFPSFSTIVRIDLSHQLIGDVNCQRLCSSIDRCPSITALNLAGNELSNNGVNFLAQIIRGLQSLSTLNLSSNKFSDSAIEVLLQKDKYCPSLTELDLTYNKLTKVSAFVISSMFVDGVLNQLKVLRLGGSGTKRLWGDQFLRVLLGGITCNKLCNLKELHVPDFCLSVDGVNTFAGLITCDELNLDILNISGNFFLENSSRRIFKRGLQLANRNFQLLANDCGFSVKELKEFAHILYSRSKETARYMRLDERWQASIVSIRTWSSGRLENFYVKQERINSWSLKVPLKWHNMQLEYNNGIVRFLSGKLLLATDKWSQFLRSKLSILNDQVLFMEKLPGLITAADSYKPSVIILNKNNKETEIPPDDPLLVGWEETIDSELLALIHEAELITSELQAKRNSRIIHWDQVVHDSVESIVFTFNSIKLTKMRYADCQMTEAQREQLEFGLEDALSRMVENGYEDIELLASTVRLRLLQAAARNQKLNPSVSFRDYIKRALPSYETLGSFGLSVYYSFIVLPSELEAQRILEQKLLEEQLKQQQLEELKQAAQSGLLGKSNSKRLKAK